MEKDPKELAEKILKAKEEQKKFGFVGRIRIIKKAFEILKSEGKLREEKSR